MTPVRADQRGVSLIETLLAVVISAALVIPLMMWLSMTFRAQPITEGELGRTAAEGLLGSYLPRDVLGAGAAAIDDNDDEVNFEDCVGAGGDDGRVVLALLSRTTVDDPELEPENGLPLERSETLKIVYSEAPGRSDGETSLWRRECRAADGSGTTSVEVVRAVDPGSSTASCPVTSADAPCRQVRLRVVPEGYDPVVMNATRRVDSASLRFDRTGNRVPIVRINLASQTLAPPYTFVLAPQATGPDGQVVPYAVDPDGHVYDYEWLVPTVPHGHPDEHAAPPEIHTQSVRPADGSGPPTGLPTPLQVVRDIAGVYFVQLTVTDNRGASTTTYKRIELVKPDPVPSILVQPPFGEAGVTNFVFEAAGSSSPAGLELTYEWTVELVGEEDPDTGEPAGDLPRYRASRASADPFSSALGQDLVGLVLVTLTATDSEGRSGTVVEQIEVTGPEPPEVPEPDPADPVASFTHAPSGDGGSVVDLDAAASSPGADGDELTSYYWDLGPHGAADGATASAVFPSAGHFPVTLTVTDAAGRSSSTTTIVTAPGTPGPVPTFTSESGWVGFTTVAGQRYTADYTFTGPGGCVAELTGVPLGEDTTGGEQVYTPILPSPCPTGAGAGAQVRIVTDHGATPVVSAPIAIEAPFAADVAGVDG